MPARIRKIRHDENTRAKIQAARLIDRIQKFALAQPTITIVPGTTGMRVTFTDENGDRVWPMTKEQVTLAKLLLDKALPSLQSVEVNAEETKTYVIRAPEPAKTAEDWLAQYGPKTIEHAPQATGKATGGKRKANGT
jgi:hypothetical protein